MEWWGDFAIFFMVFSFGFTAEPSYKLCQESNESNNCNALNKGDKVECVKALDMTHCSILMNEGKADFGVFTAEELLLAHQFYPDNLTVLADLRPFHRKVKYGNFSFEFVAIARKVSSKDPLRGNGFCHPGFNDTNSYNDYVLKYFEKEKYGRDKCQSNLSAAENEAYNLKNFFGKACRPGKWVMDRDLDVQLKKKYPELCSLCDKEDCKYINSEHHGHTGALDCLTSGRGGVTYVFLSYAKRHFEMKQINTGEYMFVCPDGKYESVDFSKQPCTWVKQPWDSVVARRSISEKLFKDLQIWKNQSNEWQKIIVQILSGNKGMTIFDQPVTSEKFLSAGRTTTLHNDTCGESIRWCTLNEMETNKCKWIATEALALGIEPKITCKQTVKLDKSLIEASRESNIFQCLSLIANSKADVMTIDSNYGSLVRQ